MHSPIVLDAIFTKAEESASGFVASFIFPPDMEDELKLLKKKGKEKLKLIIVTATEYKQIEEEDERGHLN
jgi:hypothetical protein